MAGYREDNFDLDAGEPKAPKPKGRWKWVVGTLAYMALVFWFWSMTDFPDSFGVQECRGRGCIFEDWYHSYLLIERHRLLDIATFLVMWVPIVGYIAYFALPKLKRANFSLYSDSSKGA